MFISSHKALAGALFAASLSHGATSVPIKHPITPVADSAHAFVSAPYCTGAGELPRGVYDITSGTPVKITDIPSNPGSCFETPLAMASGLGGFTPGYLYLAYPDTANSDIAHIGKIPQIGGPIQPLADLTLLAGTTQFLALRFDDVGTFGYNLIAITGQGELFVINSAGATVTHKLPTDMGLPAGTEFESPRVAPLTFGPYAGYVWITKEGTAQAFAISPITFKAVTLPMNFSGLTPPFGPEDVIFLGQNQCKYNGSTVIQAAYEAPAGSLGAVMFADMSTSSGKAMVITEDHGYAFFVNPDGTLGAQAPYSPAGNFLEHMNPITPRTDSGACLITLGCTLTQGGYKNNFNSKLLNFSAGGLLLGTNFYTNAQLNSIIQNQAVKGNGLISLAHQLITAELNIAYGAQVTPDVALAIVNAQSLIGSLLIPPVGSGYLDPSTTSSIESTLDTFNNGNAVGGPSHCQ